MDRAAARIKALLRRPVSGKKGVASGTRPKVPEDSDAERDLAEANGLAHLYDHLGGCDMWFGKRVQLTQQVHVLPHSEYYAHRPALWLRLVGLLPWSILQAEKVKSSLANVVRLPAAIHLMFADSAAHVFHKKSPPPPPTSIAPLLILFPTTGCLIQLIAHVERHMAVQCATLSRQPHSDGGWRPDFENLLLDWPHQVQGRNIYEYSLHSFDRKERFNFDPPFSWHRDTTTVVPVAVDDTWPLQLDPPLPTRALLVDPIFVTIQGLCQLWFLQPHTLKRSMQRDLDLAEHLCALLESPSSRSWASLNRPRGLNLTLPSLPNGPDLPRAWSRPQRAPTAITTRNTRPTTPQTLHSSFAAEFSSDPPSDYQSKAFWQTGAGGAGFEIASDFCASDPEAASSPDTSADSSEDMTRTILKHKAEAIVARKGRELAQQPDAPRRLRRGIEDLSAFQAELEEIRAQEEASHYPGDN